MIRQLFEQYLQMKLHELGLMHIVIYPKCSPVLWRLVIHLLTGNWHQVAIPCFRLPVRLMQHDRLITTKKPRLWQIIEIEQIQANRVDEMKIAPQMWTWWTPYLGNLILLLKTSAKISGRFSVCRRFIFEIVLLIRNSWMVLRAVF